MSFTLASVVFLRFVVRSEEQELSVRKPNRDLHGWALAYRGLHSYLGRRFETPRRMRRSALPCIGASVEVMVGQGPPFYEPTCVKCLDWDSRVAVLWFRLLGCWIGLPWCVSSLTECRRCVAWARCASPPSIRLPRWADRSPIARCAWVPDLTIRAPSIETVGSDQGGPRARIDSSTRYAGQPLGEWGLGYVVCFGPLAPRCAVLRPPAWRAQASAVRLPAPRRS
jgi:hypothetical protein